MYCRCVPDEWDASRSFTMIWESGYYGQSRDVFIVENIPSANIRLTFPKISTLKNLKVDWV